MRNRIGHVWAHDARRDRLHTQELVRLAIPRRSYTQSHMDYVLEALIAFKDEAKKLKGVRFTHKPEVLRHFTARFEWVS